MTKEVRTSANYDNLRARSRDLLDALARVQALLSRLDDVDRISFNDLIRIELFAMSSGLYRARLAGKPACGCARGPCRR